MSTMQAALLLWAATSVMGDPSDAAYAEARIEAMREIERMRNPSWHDVPETADEVEHEAMGIYTKIDSQDGHDELYAMGDGHDRKTLFRMTFAPRSEGGMGEEVGPSVRHWLIGEIPSVEAFSQVSAVEELTVESIGPAIVGPLATTDACGDFIHAHTVE
eukprot:2167740-Prymnesium_polylepis.1